MDHIGEPQKELAARCTCSCGCMLEIIGVTTRDEICFLCQRDDHRTNKETLRD